MNLEITLTQIRNYRLRIHNLNRKLPISALVDAAGVCGFQNSPPGAWESALYNRLEGCTLSLLHKTLYEEKSLLQAWSFRGAPVVFPTAQSSVFLTALIPRDKEQPWIYTRGISAALEHIQMSFDDLLLYLKRAARHLDHHTIKSKEALDQILADIIQADLPEEKKALWCAPSMYGNPDKQTAGGAAVSFLLRPCSFSSLVVFGKREGIYPTFTSFKNWLGHMPETLPDTDKMLVRKFLHCYGPVTMDAFMHWLGCSRQQAKRLWNAVTDEIEPVLVQGKTCYILSSDIDNLLSSESKEDRLLLLGAHDPYLDIRDRSVILADKSLHKMVWKTVGNPGVILKGGRIAGIWKGKTQNGRLDITLTLFETLTSSELVTLEELAAKYADFRMTGLRNFSIN